MSGKRSTQHLYFETKYSGIFIVSSLASRFDSQLIHININTGNVCYSGKIGEDLFQSEDDAIHFLQNVRKVTITKKIRFAALLGMSYIGKFANLLIATKVSEDMNLFGGHTINTIIETNWIKIPLLYPTTDQFSEPKAKIQDFLLDNLHYYCDTYDITHVFPSSHPLYDYNHEFCWNDYLAEPFEKIGLRMWCVVLLQGMAVSRKNKITKNNSDVHEFDTTHICLITRKSRVNPGTRYTARGLNKEGGPGNECECEFIVWNENESNLTGKISWMSYIWRRGTVPVWWKTTLKSSVSEPGIEVRAEEPFQGCEKYYSRLLERYGQYDVFLINMLRCDPNQKEVYLSEAYQESLKYVKGLVNVNLRLIKFDWHHIMKQLGPDTTIEGLWSLFKQVLNTTGLNQGEILFTELNNENNPTIEELQYYCPNNVLAHHFIKEKQRGISRFNCADSLDRTNIATFFLSQQLMAEICRRFNMGIDINLCVENEMNITTPWIFLKSSLSFIKKLLNKQFINSIAELFVYNGDVISMLYTNSLAMHSGLMREFSENVSSAPFNAILALKRRFQNVVFDPERQMQYEMLLGLHRGNQITGSHREKITLLSTQESSWIVNNIPTMFNEMNPSILLSQEKTFTWLCPDKVNQVEVIIYLQHPSRVTELAIVVSHGQCEEISPIFLDAYVGQYLDTTRVIFQNRQLPRCRNGTKLFYSLLPLTDPPNHFRPSHRLYDFHNADPNLRKLSRFVRLIFKGEKIGRLSIGKIEIYGCKVHPLLSPQQEYNFYKQKRSNDIVDGIVQYLNENNNNEDSYDEISGMDRYSRNYHSDTDTEEYVTISLNHGTVDEHLIDNGLDDEYLSLESPQRDISPTLPSLKRNRNTSLRSSSSPLHINSPKRPILDVSTVIEDYAGTIIKSRVNNEQDCQPKVILVQEDEPTKAPSLSCADQLSGNAEEQYKQLVKLKKRTRRDKSYEIEGVFTERPVFTLLDQLELEHFRLSNNISTTERDKLLNELGVPILLCDPTHTIFPRALLIENTRRKIEKSLSKGACSKCKQTVKIFQNSGQCYYCRLHFCSSCFQSHTSKIPEFCWDKAYPVCPNCFSSITEQKAYIPAILSLNSTDTSSRLSRQCSRFLTNVQKSAPSPTNVKFSGTQLHIPLNDYPNAGILKSVPTDPDSFPIESILMSQYLLRNGMFWSAPRGISEIDLIIVLSSDAIVSQIVLLVDALGYKKEDTPSFKIYTGENIDNFQFITEWSLPSNIIKPNSTIKLDLKKSIQCRVIKFAMKLPHLKLSREQSDDSNYNDPFFHIGRIRVFGHPLSSIYIPSISKAEQNAYESFTKFPSPFQKFTIKAASVQWNKTKTKFEINIPSGTIVSGFQIVILHNTEDGVASQVKHLRVHGITSYGVKKVQFRTIHELQTFVIPKVRPNLVLSYQFKVDVSAFHTFSFSFLSCYGGNMFTIYPCKISLFKIN